MADQLSTQLRELATAGGPSPRPPGLIETARADAPRLRARRQARKRARAGGLVAVAALLIAASFTPPGRAATGWVAGVAGIGDEPTLEHVGAEAGTAVIFGRGTAPGREPYEIVAFGTTLGEHKNFDLSESESGERDKWICPAIDFPEARVAGGEFCWAVGSGPGPVGLSAMS